MGDFFAPGISEISGLPIRGDGEGLCWEILEEVKSYELTVVVADKAPLLDDDSASVPGGHRVVSHQMRCYEPNVRSMREVGESKTR